MLIATCHTPFFYLHTSKEDKHMLSVIFLITKKFPSTHLATHPCIHFSYHKWQILPPKNIKPPNDFSSIAPKDTFVGSLIEFYSSSHHISMFPVVHIHIFKAQFCSSCISIEFPCFGSGSLIFLPPVYSLATQPLHSIHFMSPKSHKGWHKHCSKLHWLISNFLAYQFQIPVPLSSKGTAVLLQTSPGSHELWTGSCCVEKCWPTLTHCLTC